MANPLTQGEDSRLKRRDDLGIVRCMRAFSLQSGSNGNCIYVETPDARLLIDAGISGAQTARRLAERDIDVRDVDAVLISHDHWDHIASAGILHRKFQLPIHLTRKTFAVGERSGRLGRFSELRFFTAGESLRFRDTVVETLPTPHDGADGSAFVIVHGDHRLGVLTDLGHVTPGLEAVMGTLDAVFLESNYDPQMLTLGGYPEQTKARIRGPGGHLSNPEAALLIRNASGRLQWACLAHLSEHNNTPSLALETARVHLPSKFPLFAASRYGVSEMLRVF